MPYPKEPSKEQKMRIEFDNAQNTPSLTFIGNKELILAKLYLCKDGLHATGNLDVLETHFPKTDGIVLFDKDRPENQERKGYVKRTKKQQG